jgi:predicted transcriptional regulator
MCCMTTRRSRALESGSVTTKERLHKLVDELSELEAERALSLVEKEREDPMIAAFRDAPEDDEPWTDEDEAAAAEGRADIAAGRTVSHEEMLRKYG